MSPVQAQFQVETRYALTRASLDGSRPEARTTFGWRKYGLPCGTRVAAKAAWARDHVPGLERVSDEHAARCAFDPVMRNDRHVRVVRVAASDVVAVAKLARANTRARLEATMGRAA